MQDIANTQYLTQAKSPRASDKSDRYQSLPDYVRRALRGHDSFIALMLAHLRWSYKTGIFYDMWSVLAQDLAIETKAAQMRAIRMIEKRFLFRFQWTQYSPEGRRWDRHATVPFFQVDAAIETLKYHSGHIEQRMEKSEVDRFLNELQAWKKTIPDYKKRYKKEMRELQKAFDEPTPKGVPELPNEAFIDASFSAPDEGFDHEISCYPPHHTMLPLYKETTISSLSVSPSSAPPPFSNPNSPPQVSLISDDERSEEEEGEKKIPAQKVSQNEAPENLGVGVKNSEKRKPSGMIRKAGVDPTSHEFGQFMDGIKILGGADEVGLVLWKEFLVEKEMRAAQRLESIKFPAPIMWKRYKDGRAKGVKPEVTKDFTASNTERNLKRVRQCYALYPKLQPYWNWDGEEFVSGEYEDQRFPLSLHPKEFDMKLSKRMLGLPIPPGEPQ